MKENKDVWSKGSDNQLIKSFKQQQQSTALKPSIETTSQA